MQYTPNYNFDLPEANDGLETASRISLDDNFTDLDTLLKDIEDDIDDIQDDISDLDAKTGDDIPFESGSADSISDKITILSNLLNGVETRTLLWTNASPSSAFASQTISLDLSEYDRIELYSVNDTNTSIRHYATIDIGSTFIVNYISIPGNYMEGYSRSVGTTSSGINFGACYKSNGVEDNTKAIPYKIYGIKKVVA